MNDSKRQRIAAITMLLRELLNDELDDLAATPDEIEDSEYADKHFRENISLLESVINRLDAIE
jgi:hypothetical protein